MASKGGHEERGGIEEKELTGPNFFDISLAMAPGGLNVIVSSLLLFKFFTGTST